MYKNKQELNRKWNLYLMYTHIRIILYIEIVYVQLFLHKQITLTQSLHMVAERPPKSRKVE